MNSLKTSAKSKELCIAIITRIMHPEVAEVDSNAYFYGKLDSLMDTLFQLSEPINNWEV